MQRIARSIVDGSFYTLMDSPVGTLTLVGEHAGLSAILWDCDFTFGENRSDRERLRRKDGHPLMRQARLQLREYFQEKRTTFDIPLVFHGTPFQKQVWNRLLEIPYGETRSYQQQAARVGDINKVRAVGAANGKNPISIVVPCHRVIGKNGSLTGFGGGLGRKRLLLDLESGNVSRSLF